MYVIYDEVNKNVKLIENDFDGVIFDVSFSDALDAGVMIDFFLLYAKIALFG
jgi:predicted phosphoadenosine phosphosulfate sulfurtransferase